MPVFDRPRWVRLLKPIHHYDWSGALLEFWPAGSLVSVTADAGHYWVGSPDVFKEEGDLLDDEVDERFIQLSDN